MLTVVLRGHIDAIRQRVEEHLPGARMRYNSDRNCTAIQHEALSDLGETGIVMIARSNQLPYVCCVDIKPFATEAA